MKTELELRTKLLYAIDIAKEKIKICESNSNKHPHLRSQMYELIRTYEKQIQAFSEKIAKIDVKQ